MRKDIGIVLFIVGRLSLLVKWILPYKVKIRIKFGIVNYLSTFVFICQFNDHVYQLGAG